MFPLFGHIQINISPAWKKHNVIHLNEASPVVGADAQGSGYINTESGSKNNETKDKIIVIILQSCKILFHNIRNLCAVFVRLISLHTHL